MLKGNVKNRLIGAIAKFGQQNWSFLPNRLIVLMYHRVLPRNYNDMPLVQPGMAVLQDTFEQHIRLLKTRFQLVSLQEWLAKVHNGEPLPRQACAITFDDGWYDNYEYAWPILKKYEVPATIFVVANKVGAEYAFWPETLARIIWNGGHGLDPAIWQSERFCWLNEIAGFRFDSMKPTRDVINTIIEKIKLTYTDCEIIKLLNNHDITNIQSNNNIERDLMDWNEISEMESTGLIDIGCHSLNHIRMTENTKRSILFKEIIDSKKIIQQKIGADPVLFCYPNGNFCEAAESLVRSNYLGALTTTKGWNNKTLDPYRIKRIGMHQDVSDNDSKFLARLSGWI